MSKNNDSKTGRFFNETKIWILGTLALLAKVLSIDALKEHLPKQNPIQWLKSDSTQWAAALVLLVFGGFIRSTKLNATGLNMDEMFNYLWAKDSLFERLFGDIHPPLYPLLSKPFLWLGIEWGTRLVSVVAGVFFCFIIWRIAKKMSGPTVGIITLLFAVLSPSLIWMSRTGQGYQLFATLVALMFLAFLWISESTTWKTTVLYALFTTAALYSFYYALLPWLFFTIASVVVLVKNRESGIRLLVGNMVSIVLFSPMIFAWIKVSDQLGAIFTKTPLVNNPIELVLNFIGMFLRFSPAVSFAFLMRIFSFHGILHIIGIFLSLVVVTCLVVFGILGARRRGSLKSAVPLWFGFYIFIILGTLLLNWLYRFPLEDQYLMFISLVTIPIVANACLWPKNKIISVFFIILFSIGCLSIVTKVENPFVEEHREVVWMIKKLSNKNALITTVNYHMADLYEVYGNKNNEQISLPADLPGRKILFREQKIDIRPSDVEFIKGKLKEHNMIIVIASDTISGGMGQRDLDLLKLLIAKEGFVGKERIYFKSRKGYKTEKDGTLIRFVRMAPPEVPPPAAPLIKPN